VIFFLFSIILALCVIHVKCNGNRNLNYCKQKRCLTIFSYLKNFRNDGYSSLCHSGGNLFEQEMKFYFVLLLNRDTLTKTTVYYAFLSNELINVLKLFATSQQDSSRMTASKISNLYYFLK